MFGIKPFRRRGGDREGERGKEAGPARKEPGGAYVFGRTAGPEGARRRAQAAREGGVGPARREPPGDPKW